MSTVDRCTNEDCTCGIRCPKCEANFVNTYGELCERCDPCDCEKCGTSSHSLFKKWRSGTKSLLLCDDCFNSTSEQCKECERFTDVTVKGLCPECLLKSGWKAKGSHGLCTDCKKAVPVNIAGLCVECYSEREKATVKGKSLLNMVTKGCITCGDYTKKGEKQCIVCKDLTYDCPTCKESFTQVSEIQTQCKDCRPQCISCGEDFHTNSYARIFCQPCAAKMASWICTKCNKQITPAERSLEGYCSSCTYAQAKEARQGHRELRVLHHSCVRCGITRVPYFNGVCQTCSTQTFTCPACEKNVIDSTEIICKHCDSSRRKQFRLLRSRATKGR